METGKTRLDLLREEILEGSLNRRAVLKRAMALGLSAPVITGLLAACGGEEDDEPTDESAATEPATTGQVTQEANVATEEATEAVLTPDVSVTATVPAVTGSPQAGGQVAVDQLGEGAGRGQGDLVRVLYWQAPTILNPHFAQGDKDSSAASVVLEPLLWVDPAGELIPALAAEVPTLENGGISPDGMSVTYKLKEGVTWSDGEPFTAEDVKFTWEWVTNPESSATTFASYDVIGSVDVIDDHTVRLNFKDPNPGWMEPFVTGYGGQVLPKHVMQDFVGAAGRDAPFNLSPVGTGAYSVAEFRPGDVVLYEINENYRDETRPFFQQVELKGGGDATSAARAALQTGETDYGWNLQVEKQILEEMAAGAEFGELLIVEGQSVERILINFANPREEVDGAFSEPTTQHPWLSELPVRQALAKATDRETIAGELYGASGKATTNLLVAPEVFVSPNTSHTFDVQAAAQMLEEAGWTGSPRSKNGVQMQMLYQTTVNPVRQKTQEIVKAAWEQMGVPTEIKAIDAGVFFSSDAGNPDTAGHFYADCEMYTNGPTTTYPIAYMAGWKSNEPEKDLAQKANQWSGGNYNRWVNEEYNQLYLQAEKELDPEKQQELFIAMNDMVVNEVVEIPLVHRALVSAKNKQIQGNIPSSWEPETFSIFNWYME